MKVWPVFHWWHYRSQSHWPCWSPQGPSEKLCHNSSWAQAAPIFRKKDTRQGIHLALYWLQHPPLRSHIFFRCHGNAGERKRIKLLELRIIHSSHKRRASRQRFFRGQWMGWSNMNETTIFPLISVFYRLMISVLYKMLAVWNTEVFWNRQGLTFLLQPQWKLVLPYKQHKNYALMT